MNFSVKPNFVIQLLVANEIEIPSKENNKRMNSEEIFNYSDEFLSEITDHLISLKTQRLTSSNEFNNQLKVLLGKNIDDNEFENLISHFEVNISNTNLIMNFRGNFHRNRKLYYVYLLGSIWDINEIIGKFPIYCILWIQC